jgi:rubrerythrin
MEKTIKNLKAAFSGESEANRKYLAFAKKAEEEGIPNLARLFRVVAEGETVHALNHLRTLGEVKDAKNNLEVAVSGETYEIEKMYPEFIKEAAEENQLEAKISFEKALKVEYIHRELFQKSLEKINSGDIGAQEYFVCPVCGFPARDEAPEKCPICGAPQTSFRNIS